MNIIDYIAKFFLAFSNDIILVPLIIIGFICVNHRLYGGALILLLFTMIFNRVLKEYFAIPLNPALNLEGFAFPSGHMQSSIVFYGWLFLFSNKMIRLGLVALLCGIGFALIHHGYHNINDILAAIAFGLITIFVFYNLSKFELFSEYPYLLGWLTIPFAFTLMFYSNCIKHIPAHLWLAFYVLVGFTLSWTIFDRNLNHPKKIREKILGATLALLIIGGIYYMLPTFKNMLPSYLQLQWFIVGFAVPFSLSVSRYLCKEKNG